MRPVKLSDAPNYVRWFNDKKVIKYLANQSGITLAKEKIFIRNIIKNKNDICLAMIAETGKHIGSAGVKINPEHRRAEYGIIIGDKSEWGKKYAQESIMILADYVFKKLKFNRLELSVYAKNERAVHVYKKMGFKVEGRRRRYLYNKIIKHFEDDLVMSILRDEWLKKRRLILTKKCF